MSHLSLPCSSLSVVQGWLEGNCLSLVCVHNVLLRLDPSRSFLSLSPILLPVLLLAPPFPFSLAFALPKEEGEKAHCNVYKFLYVATVLLF